MSNVRQLDGRLARDVESLARWWTQATQEARFEFLKTSKEKGIPWEAINAAIILAETEAGEVSEG